MAYTCNLLLRTLPAIGHEPHPEHELVGLDPYATRFLTTPAPHVDPRSIAHYRTRMDRDRICSSPDEICGQFDGMVNGPRYSCPAVSTLPFGKDISRIDLSELSEDE